MRGARVLMINPPLGEHVFLFRFQQRELANFLQIAVQALFRAGCGKILIGAHVVPPLLTRVLSQAPEDH